MEPSSLTLASGESKLCTVKMQVGDRLPPGGHQQQELLAIANGNAAAASKLSLITVCELPHPYILHTPAR